MSRRRRLALIVGGGILGLTAVLLIAGILIVRAVWFQDMVRNKIVAAVEMSSGGRTEIGSFTFDWTKLRAQVRGFVLHGTEPAGAAPLFQARLLQVDLKITSPFKNFVDIRALVVDQPQANIIVYPDGSTNVPAPKIKHESNKTALQTIVDLAIGRFDLTNGSLTFASRQTPLDAHCENLRAQLTYDILKRAYQGEISLHPLAARSGGNAPIDIDVTLPVVLERDRVQFNNARIHTPESEAFLSGAMDHLVSPHTLAHVNARISLAELARTAGSAAPVSIGKNTPRYLNADTTIEMDESRIRVTSARATIGQSDIEASGVLKDAHTRQGSLQFNARLVLGELGRMMRISGRPEGTVELGGNARLGGANDYQVAAKVHARGVSFQQGTTRLSGVALAADVNASPQLIELTGMRLSALGGSYIGRASLANMADLRLSGNLEHFDIQELAYALTSRRPAWSGVISGPIEAEDNLRAPGTQGIQARARLNITPGPSGTPVSGRISVAYNGPRDAADVDHSYLALPSTRLDFSGSLGREIDVRLASRNLNDLAPALALASGNRPQQLPVTLNGGAAVLTAKVTGKVTAPRIAGHLAVNQFTVEGRPFSSLAADLDASSSGASVRNGLVARGPLQVQFTVSVGLRDWKPEDREPLRADLSVRNADVQDLLALAGETNVPVTGAITVAANISGTIGDPRGSATVNVLRGEAYKEHFDRLDAQVVLANRLVTIPSAAIVAGTARVDLNASFQHPADSLRSGVIRAHIASNQMDLDQFRTPGQKRANVSGTARITADAVADLRPAGGSEEIQLASVNADIHARGLQMEAQNVGDLDLTAQTSGRDVTYRLNSDFAGSSILVNGRTMLARDYPTTASAAITRLPIDRVLAVAGRRDIPAAGMLAVEAKVSGTTADPHADARLSVTKGKAYDEAFDSLQTHVILTSQTVDLPDFRFAAGQSSLQAKATFTHPANDYQSGQLQFHIDSSRVDVGQFHHVQEFKPGLAGTVRLGADGAAALRGAHATPPLRFSSLNANLNATGLSVERRPLGDLNATATTRGTSLDFNLKSNFARANIQGSGQMQLTGDYPLNAQISFAGVTWSGLEAWVGPSPRRAVDALLEGKASVQGPAAKPEEIGGLVQVTKLEVRGMPAKTQAKAKAGAAARPPILVQNTGPIVVQLDHSTIRIQSANLSGTDAHLTLSGTASLKDPKPLDIRMNGELGLALVGAFYSDILADGSVALAAAAQGTLADPVVNGTLQLKNASLNMLELPNGISEANGSVQFNGREAVIQNIRGKTGGGTIVLGGIVEYGEPEMNLRVTANANRVRIAVQEGVSAHVNAALNLNGATRRSLLSGNVTILSVAMQSHTDIGSILSSAGDPPSSPSAKEGLLGGMQFDVRIETAPDVQFKTSLSQNLQAEAHLRLRGTPSNPGMLGRVDVTQGEVIFFGNKYKIDDGTVAFYNPQKIDPILNIGLSTKVQGVDVVLSVSGSMDRLKFSYTSDPPMQFSDLVALLGTGKLSTTDPVLAARQPVAPQQNWQQMGASTLLGQAVANPVSGRLQRLFGVSSLKIDPKITGDQNSPQARLTMEQQITKTLTFTYIQDVTQTNMQTVRIEWAPGRTWSAVAVRDQDGQFGLDIYYKKRLR